MTDIEIAQACQMQPIGEIARRAHIDEQFVEPYGRYKAKINPAALKGRPEKDGRPSRRRLRAKARPRRPSAWATACAASVRT